MSPARHREVAMEVRLAASPREVWRLLADHEGMPRWAPVREAVRRRPGTPDPDGAGAVRTLKSGGLVFDEEIVDWKPGERLGYRITAGAPLREHQGRVQLFQDGRGTRLVWSVGFRPVVPGTGAWIERRVRAWLAGAARGLERELGAP